MVLRPDLTAGDLGHITDHEEIAQTLPGLLTQAAASATYLPTVLTKADPSGATGSHRVADPGRTACQVAEVYLPRGTFLSHSGSASRTSRCGWRQECEAAQERTGGSVRVVTGARCSVVGGTIDVTAQTTASFGLHVLDADRRSSTASRAEQPRHRHLRAGPRRRRDRRPA